MNLSTQIEKRISVKKCLIFIVAGILLSCFVTIFFTIFRFKGNGSAIELTYGDGLKLLIFSIVISPILEELFFRLFIYGKLLRKKIGMSALNATLVVSVIFGVLHFPISTMVITMLLSGILCYIYEKEGSVIYDIIFHMSYNLPSLIIVIMG